MTLSSSYRGIEGQPLEHHNDTLIPTYGALLAHQALLKMLYHFFLTITPQGWYFHYLHFTTEAQKVQINCSGSHSQEAQTFKTRTAHLQPGLGLVHLCSLATTPECQEMWNRDDTTQLPPAHITRAQVCLQHLPANHDDQLAGEGGLRRGHKPPSVQRVSRPRPSGAQTLRCSRSTDSQSGASFQLSHPQSLAFL